MAELRHPGNMRPQQPRMDGSGQGMGRGQQQIDPRMLEMMSAQGQQVQGLGLPEGMAQSQDNTASNPYIRPNNQMLEALMGKEEERRAKEAYQNEVMEFGTKALGIPAAQLAKDPNAFAFTEAKLGEQKAQQVNDALAKRQMEEEAILQGQLAGPGGTPQPDYQAGIGY